MTGLVKGPGAVRCPECGGETEHVGGEAVPKGRDNRSMLKALGAAGVVAIALPSAIVITMVYALGSRQAGTSLLIAAIAWAASTCWAVCTSRHHGYTNGERVAVGIAVAIVAGLPLLLIAIVVLGMIA